jgi:hypothetical protein
MIFPYCTSKSGIPINLKLYENVVVMEVLHGACVSWNVYRQNFPKSSGIGGGISLTVNPTGTARPQ